MKLIKPSTEILTIINSGEIFKTLEQVARTCYKSEDRITEDGESAKKILNILLTRNHEAMLEFFDITVKFIVDRGVSHEIVRHRIGSYAQESTRYVNYATEGKIGHCTFIIPPWCNISESEWTHEQAIQSTDMNGDINALLWLQHMSWTEKVYNKLIKEGWKAEEARSVLPNSTKTEINVKFNLREWRHFFKLRTAAAAHPQMREVTIPLLKEFQEKIPIIFDNI
jgi:thymidylate synthase (FAD)